MRYAVKLFLSLWLLTLITACDKIDAPYERQVTHGSDTSGVLRKILLEDYTGHKCNNCPTAGVTARDLMEDYPEQMVVIAIHAGYYATPDLTGEYTTDFRTAAGDELYTYFDIASIGNPSGMVDRTVYNQNLILGPEMWGAAALQLLDIPADATIELGLTYDTPSRLLSGDCHIQFLNQLSGQFMFCLYLIENDIVAPQKNKDSTIGPTPDWLDYVHEHVLRGAINGTWGEQINTGEVQTNLKYHITFSGFEIKPEWKPQNCQVVAFIYNSGTKEVIQAEESDIE
jgi:hypothetical protein